MNTFNIDAIEKSHELKGSTKDFIQNDNSPKDNYINIYFLILFIN